MSLRDKVELEMSEFKKSYDDFTAVQAYNDWYVIAFYESYSELLCSDYIQKSDKVVEWLGSMDKPLGFLYEQWTSCDGALNLDWDAMVEWLEDLHMEIGLTGLDCLIAEASEKDDKFDGLNEKKMPKYVGFEI